MKIKFKDLEFIIKKFFFSQSYLLKKRLLRAINNNYEKELTFIDRFSDKSKNAIDIGVYRGVYSFKLSQNFKQIYAFEPNPLLFPYFIRGSNQRKSTREGFGGCKGCTLFFNKLKNLSRYSLHGLSTR